MAEINLNPHKLPARSQWKDRFRTLRSNKNFAYNKFASRHIRDLYGGTAYLTSPNTSHRVVAVGEDESGLGRWTWVQLIGRGGIHTRILTGYRPVEDTSDRAGSVYSQHQQEFIRQKNHREPRKAFLDDLQKQISDWMDAGDQIIIGLDLNDDTWASPAANRIASWGLVNTLKTKHPDLPKVATHDKNTRDIPIDGIWTTPGLDVTAAGMLAFGSPNLDSCDHRVLWVDFTTESMYGYRPPALQPPLCLGILLNDPRHVEKMNRQLKRERRKANIPNKILFLEQRAKAKLYDSDNDVIFNVLMQQDFEIRKKLLTKLRKKYAGQVEFSDEIGRARREIYLYNLALRKATKRRMDTRKIHRLMSKLDKPRVLRLSEKELHTARQLSITNYRKTKKRHRELRQEFRLKVCKRRASRYKTSVETQEKIVQNAFRQKGAHSQVRRVMKANERATIKYVERTNAAGEDEACYSREEIESACCDEGYQRYSQAQATPFLQSPLLEEIGTLGNQDVIEAIIRGTYVPPEGVDKFTKLLIDEMKAPPGALEAESINGYVTTQEHSAGWKKMKSKIAVSPFGPTISEYIAGTDDAEISEIDAAMASIPALTGIAPSFWAKGVDVMIPKKTVSKRVEKLRIIVLFHALFNQFNKRVSRKMIARAEAIHAIASEICGGRHRFRSVECGLNKSLALDGVRQRHLPAILCSNDAKSCYDRIVHSVANICMQRLGVDHKTCSVMLGTIQQMQHHVKTAFGVSEKHYGCVELPLQGVLQGNGAGPAIWLVVSMPLVQMLKRQGYGLNFKNSMNDEGFQFSCFTFVDDTDMIHVGSDGQLFEDVLIDMQDMIDLWAGGLHATGGKLVIKDKSYWYGIDFSWDKAKNKWDYRRIEDMPGELTLDVPTEGRAPIERLAVGTAKETLGIWTTANGDQKRQEAELRKKVTIWGDKIRTKQLTRTAAWLSLRSGITKSLQYPLTATRLSKKACSNIDKDLRKIALPALGIPRSFPTVLTHAPREILGLGIPSMWTQQANDHITCILRHGDSPVTDSTGCLLRDTMANLRLELGLPGHPFQHSYKKFAICTTSVWLHTSWEFCEDHHLQIHDNQNQLHLLRVDDSFIMQGLADVGYEGNDLYILNICRLWLKVITLADITTGDGRAISRNFRTHQIQATSNDHLKWPKAGTPSNKAWELWDEALERAFLLPNDRHCRLRRPMGPWLVSPPNWPLFFSSETNTLYQTTSTRTWRLLCNTHTNRQAQFTATANLTNCLPDDAQPTTGIGRHEVRIEGYRHIQPTSDAPSQETQWWGHVHHMPQNIQPILDGIAAGTAVCITDGSYKNGYGTAAFKLSPHLDSLDGIICVNQTPGFDTEIDPYRSELGGVYGCIALVNELMDRHDLSTGAITIGCDCKSVGHNLFTHQYENPKQSHFDLLHGARQILQRSQVQWTYHHVPGHQDDHLHYSLLDRWGQLNVDMDTLAKQHWCDLNVAGWKSFSLPPTTEWSIWHRQRRITSWDSQSAIQLAHEHPATTYWQTKLKVPVASSDIAWTSRKMAATSLPDFRKLWHMKWFTNRVATNGNLEKWGLSRTNACPRCGQPESDRMHVIKCSHHTAVTCWDMSVNKLADWLHGNKAQPDLAAGLIAGLRAWQSDTIPTLPTSTWPGVAEALHAQSLIGWDRTFDGIFHHSWIDTQESYSRWLHRRTTGKRWVSRLIRQLWEVAWDMWRHRQAASEEETSATLAATHDALNSDIDAQYQHYAAHPYPTLARFFARDPEVLYTESIDFKQHWIVFVAQAARFYGHPEGE